MINENRHDLAYHFFDLVNRYEAILASYAQKLGLTTLEFHILLTLARNEGDEFTQSDLAFQLHELKQTISAAVKRLIGRELVSLKTSPKDGRAKTISLSDKGQQFIDEHVNFIIDQKMACFDQLEPGQADLLINISEEYISILEKQN